MDTLTLLLEAGMLAAVWGGESYAIHIGGWDSPFGIALMVDGFSSFMLLVSTVVSLAVLLFATSQGLADGDEPGPVSIFHPAYLILLAGVSNAFLAAEQVDLFRIVHGDQKFSYARPVVPGDVLTATLTVASLRQIGGADIIGTTSEVTDADGALVCTTGATLVHKGADA